MLIKSAKQFKEEKKRYSSHFRFGDLPWRACLKRKTTELPFLSQPVVCIIWLWSLPACDTPARSTLPAKRACHIVGTALELFRPARQSRVVYRFDLSDQIAWLFNFLFVCAFPWCVCEVANVFRWVGLKVVLLSVENSNGKPQHTVFSAQAKWSDCTLCFGCAGDKGFCPIRRVIFPS